MIKAPIDVQELQRRIYRKAKAEKSWRFWGIYVHVCKREILIEAYKRTQSNNGVPGVDGVTFEEVERQGLDGFLEQIAEELRTEQYKPLKNRNVEIPKGNGKTRTLSIPSIRDRVVQGALKLILEPIFEADFEEGSYGFRPKRSQHQAIKRVESAVVQGKRKVIDLDLKAYFDSVKHDILLQKIACRVNDDSIMRLVKLVLKSCGKRGLPQGGPLSPLLSNLYLNEVDKMLEKAREVTSRGKYTHIEYCRFADDIVILVDQHRKWKWLFDAAYKRLCQELSKIGVELNEEKTKLVDLEKGEGFEFLGFRFKRRKTRNQKWAVLVVPTMKKRRNLLQTLTEIFNKWRSQPIMRVIGEINPIIRGWVNYFRIGNSSRCFSYVRYWIEKKVRRHLMRARKRSGFGWKRWSSEFMYQCLGIYNDYQIKRT